MDKTLTQDIADLRDNIFKAIDLHTRAFHETWGISPSNIVIDMGESTQVNDSIRSFAVSEIHIEFNV